MRNIFSEINKFLKKDYIFFTTPGHKQGRAYKNIRDILRYDLTEVQGLDNLHNPKGCLLNSLRELSMFYESIKSYYLLNGSTSGIQIMIFSCFNEYDEILVERGCHKSIIDAIFLRKLKVNYINREKYNVDLLLFHGNSKINYSKDRIFLREIEEAVQNNDKIKGVILTNPNYYGFYVNQEEIYRYLKSKNILLLIDSAHGAHIRGFNNELTCTNKFCDVCVMSAHKTLPVLTQGAYMHVNNSKIIENTDRYFSIFTTTSPSYLIMLSLENAVYEFINCDSSSHKLLQMCSSFRSEIIKNTYVDSVQNDDVMQITNKNFYYDDCRICLKFKYSNLSPNRFYKYLLSKRIVCEMSFFNGVILIPTLYTKKCEIEYLSKVINNMSSLSYEYLDSDLITNSCSGVYKKIFDPYELHDKRYKVVKLEDSVGEVLFNDIFLYPPGTPIIFRGEEILVQHLEIIFAYIKNCYNVSGVLDGGYIKILED